MSVSIKIFGEEWISEYFAMADKMDPEALISHYTEDGTFTFSNQPQVQGKAAIKETLKQFWGTVTSMRHEKTGCWFDSTSGVFESIVHFGIKDGRSVSIPAISTLRLKGGLIQHFIFVMDPTPLFHP
ncbi:MAG: nuclear transport factor 2 family protein [Cyanobacteria bacterium]|nr:nuclear transport factor 2 family protein [Cyanobacteriota bacterium]